MPYADFAKLIGLDGLRVDNPEQVGPAWDSARGPVSLVLDMVTDPNVPPLPPHITLKQARAFMGAMIAGEPEAGSIIANTARGLLRSFIPGRKEPPARDRPLS